MEIKEEKMEKKYEVKEEQIAYAKLLDIGMKIGLILIIISFVVYVIGLLPNQVPIEKLPEYWKLKAYKYLEIADIKPGWNWIYIANKGDYLNFIGIAFLGAVTLFCYIRIFPIFLKKKDIIYFILTLIEIVVLVFAASGILHVGAH